MLQNVFPIGEIALLHVAQRVLQSVQCLKGLSVPLAFQRCGQLHHGRAGGPGVVVADKVIEPDSVVLPLGMKVNQSD